MPTDVPPTAAGHAFPGTCAVCEGATHRSHTDSRSRGSSHLTECGATFAPDPRRDACANLVGTGSTDCSVVMLRASAVLRFTTSAVARVSLTGAQLLRPCSTRCQHIQRLAYYPLQGVHDVFSCSCRSEHADGQPPWIGIIPAMSQHLHSRQDRRSREDRQVRAMYLSLRL